MSTYITHRPQGMVRSVVIRTELSQQRASKRAILREPARPYTISPQDVADEKHLSRSKPYPNKGLAEAGRRLDRDLRRVSRMETASLVANEDFDAMKREQEVAA